MVELSLELAAASSSVLLHIGLRDGLGILLRRRAMADSRIHFALCTKKKQLPNDFKSRRIWPFQPLQQGLLSDLSTMLLVTLLWLHCNCSQYRFPLFWLRLKFLWVVDLMKHNHDQWALWSLAARFEHVAAGGTGAREKSVRKWMEGWRMDGWGHQNSKLINSEQRPDNAAWPLQWQMLRKGGSTTLEASWLHPVTAFLQVLLSQKFFQLLHWLYDLRVASLSNAVDKNAKPISGCKAFMGRDSSISPSDCFETIACRPKLGPESSTSTNEDVWIGSGDLGHMVTFASTAKVTLCSFYRVTSTAALC